MELIVDFPHPNVPWNMPPPRVTFASRLEMKIVEDLSLKHKEDLWFSSQEMGAFKAQAATTLREMLLGHHQTVGAYAMLKTEETCSFMGFENFLSKDVGQEVKDRREAIRKAVLLEQKRQREMGVEDPEATATVSESCSAQSRLRARLVGLLHADT